MKRLLTLFFALSLYASVFGQTSPVTLIVDMKNEAVGADGVHIAGDLQEAAGIGPNWTPSATGTALTDLGGNLWGITLNLPDGSYNYKFVNGFGGWENVPSACASGGNRGLTVAGSATSQQWCYGSCDVSCPSTIPVDVTFRVNMANETVSADGVHIAGSLQGWNPSTTELTDPDGDGIYEVTLTLANGFYEYKFLNGNSWGTDESIPCSCASGNNRSVDVPYQTDPLVLDAVCFRSCTAECPPTSLVSMTFSVDMTNEIVGPGGVFVAGSFQEPAWQKNATAMTDPDGDGIYTVTVAVKHAEHQYLFFNGDYALSPDPTNTDYYKETGDFTANGCGCGGFNNRVVDASAATGAIMLPTYVYGQCTTTVPANPIVTIAADMINETVSADGVNLAGDLQEAAGFGPNWTPSATGNELSDADGDGIYTITFQIAPGSYNYKIVNGNDAWENVPGACASGGNRALVVTTDNVAQQNCYGSCDESCPVVVPVNVTFRVDMTNEVVSANGVHIAGSLQGWNPGATELTDPDGDHIYEVTLVLNNGTYEYKFLNGNDWGTDEQVPCGCASGNNRAVTVPAVTNYDVPVVCFRSCSAVCPPTSLVNVTFNVDMTNELLGPGGVFVAGSFQDPAWVKNAVAMSDPDADGIYSVTVPVKQVEHQYLFFNGDYALGPDPTNTDYYKETANFSSLGCGCGGFNNRVFDGSTLPANGQLPAYVYNACDLSTIATHDLSTATDIRLFPNPMSEQAKLKFTNTLNSTHRVVVTDVAGKVVREYQQVTGSEMFIRKENLQPGLYLITISNEKGETSALKFGIQ